MDTLVEVAQQSTVLVEDAAQLIEIEKRDSLVSEEVKNQIVEVQEPSIVLVQVDAVQIVSEGLQGPPGSVEEDVPYSKRIDFVTDEILYKGLAQPGSNESDMVWRISRITISSEGDTLEEWAEGSALFNKAWSDRASFSYS